MNLDLIVKAWRDNKVGCGSHRLGAPCSVEHEYQGRQWGHPSTYAFVRFECVPSDELVVEMRASWPASVSRDYAPLVQNAVTAAIVDVLLGDEDPYTGCSLSCVEVRWDDVASSERSFYRATRTAMKALREREWLRIPRDR